MIETHKIKPIETESEWLNFKSRFDDYENGMIDRYSGIYHNRNISRTISLDEIAEDWQKPQNYYGLRIVEHTYCYLSYSLCCERISFEKYLELKNRIALSDSDHTYSACIRILKEANYE